MTLSTATIVAGVNVAVQSTNEMDGILTMQVGGSTLTICQTCMMLSSETEQMTQGSLGFQEKSEILAVCPPWMKRSSGGPSSESSGDCSSPILLQKYEQNGFQNHFFIGQLSVGLLSTLLLTQGLFCYLPTYQQNSKVVDIRLSIKHSTFTHKICFYLK